MSKTKERKTKENNVKRGTDRIVVDACLVLRTRKNHSGMQFTHFRGAGSISSIGELEVWQAVQFCSRPAENKSA